MEEINKNLPCKNEEAIVTEVAPDKMLVWHEFRKNPCDEMRNQLIEKYLHLVKYNAERIWARLPDGVELDDLISAGVFGLMDAISAFDTERGVKFETYCVPRIRGAMLDELRSMDWVPRLVRSKASKMATWRHCGCQGWRSTNWKPRPAPAVVPMPEATPADPRRVHDLFDAAGQVTGERRSDNYWLANFNAEYKLTRSIAVSGFVKNAFDKQYLTNNRDDDIIDAGAPRTFGVALRYDL